MGQLSLLTMRSTHYRHTKNSKNFIHTNKIYPKLPSTFNKHNTITLGILPTRIIDGKTLPVFSFEEDFFEDNSSYIKISKRLFLVLKDRLTHAYANRDKSWSIEQLL